MPCSAGTVTATATAAAAAKLLPVQHTLAAPLLQVETQPLADARNTAPAQLLPSETRKATQHSEPTGNAMHCECNTPSSPHCHLTSRTESIREFIQREAPLRTIDGSFNERPLKPTLEAPFIILPLPAPTDDAPPSPSGQLPSLSFRPPCPGAVSLHALSQRDLESVVSNGGQIILVVADLDQDGGAPRVAQPRMRRGSSGGSGSYCCAARVAGLFGGMACVVAEQRVAVQALDVKRGLAQAALLPDRWAYMVRASAVEEAVKSQFTASGASSGGAAAAAAGAAAAAAVPRDVRTAVEQILDAAQEAARMLIECRQLAAALADSAAIRAAAAAAAGGAGAASGAAVAAERLELLAREAEAEISALLEWVFGSEADLADAAGSGEIMVGSWDQIVKLSWALFAAAEVQALADAGFSASGISIDGGVLEGERVVRQQRLRAMEAMDLGLRMEDALEVVGKARVRLAAVLALKR